MTDEDRDMPAEVMSAYMDLVVEEMQRLDHALVEFMDELNDDQKVKLASIIIETCERRRSQAQAAHEMIRDASNGEKSAS